MIQEKAWNEFQNAGLLLFINQILHIFGWAIVFQVNDDNVIEKVYPARVKFRGFDNDSVSKAYLKLSTYMNENSEELLKEASSE